MDINRLQNIAAEGSILGAILKDNNCLLDVVDIINVNDFSVTKNKIIYSCMINLFKKSEVIDPVTLYNELLENKETSVTITTITELLDSGVIHNVKDYAKIIKEKSVMRNLDRAVRLTVKEIEDGSQSSNDIISSIQQTILPLTAPGKVQAVDDIVLMEKTMSFIQENYEKGGGIIGLKCGIKVIDKAINGFQKGKLYTIGGRPGMCKSAVALNIATNISMEHSVLLYSMEMKEEELGLRKLAMKSHVDMALIERGILNNEQWAAVTNAFNKLSTFKCVTDCSEKVHINTIRAACKKMKLQQGLDMLVVDYIGLMDKKGMGASLREQIGAICEEFKCLAKEFDIPVIILSQINRSVEATVEKIPTLSDLKESGGIEENSDVVFLLYRDEYYNKDNSKRPGILDLIIAKQRGGRTGNFELSWKGEYQLISDIDYRYVGKCEPEKIFKK